jgi:hypothetical protein
MLEHHTPPARRTLTAGRKRRRATRHGVFCLAYGESCRGLEHEWWNESEWEEFEDHLPSG